MTRIDEYINWLATLFYAAKTWLLVVVRLVAKIATGNVLAFGFYRFPITDRVRRLKWLKALKRQNWIPTVHAWYTHEFVVTILYQVCTAICSQFVRVNFTVSFNVQENRSTTAAM